MSSLIDNDHEDVELTSIALIIESLGAKMLLLPAGEGGDGLNLSLPGDPPPGGANPSLLPIVEFKAMFISKDEVLLSLKTVL